MVLSMVQFVVSLMLAALCSRAIILSGGDVPLLALLIPALWIFPQRGFSGLLFLAALCLYGLTLPYLPVALSLSVWILFPILMVAYSERSSRFVKWLLALCVLSMQSGILLTQSSGRMEGSVGATLVQLVAVVLAWYACHNWKPSRIHSWWSLLFIVPMWLAGWQEATLVALSVIGIMAACESIKDIASFHWHDLLCWSLPTVGFAAILTIPDVEIPSQVLVAWLFMLASAWGVDYLTQLDDEE
jgi:hypothetical protein